MEPYGYDETYQHRADYRQHEPDFERHPHGPQDRALSGAPHDALPSSSTVCEIWRPVRIAPHVTY